MPLISAAQRERVMGYIQAGKDEGAQLVTGGEAPEGNGYFFRGTALAMQEANDYSGVGAISSKSGSDSVWSEVNPQLALSRADGGSLKALEVEQVEQMATPLFAPEDISLSNYSSTCLHRMRRRPRWHCCERPHN